MPAMTYPTSPTESSGTTCCFGLKIPTSCTSPPRPVPIIRIFMPGRIVPS
jgi:hypothetical protein